MFPKQESSFAEYYINAIKKFRLPYDIVYFERYDINRQAEDNEVLFSRYCPTGGSKLKKIGIMIDYMRFINRVAKSDKYYKVIVLTTVPAVMLYETLIKNYKERYILDIRDYTHESNKLYFSMVERLIKSSFMTVLSSKGFLKFLPKSDKYTFTHNIPVNYSTKDRVIDMNNAIKIGFVGSVRYYEENVVLINQFANNIKYELHYYGNFTSGCDLEKYCRSSGITNVYFHGAFNNDDKPEIYKNIDFINSIYGIKGLETTTAIPNRLYDSAIYRCPIIVSKNTYLAEVVEQYNMGFAVDINKDNVKDILDRYISNYDKETFTKGCDDLLSIVNEDMHNLKEKIENFMI